MRSSAVLALLLAGCLDRPDPLIVCHNANCAPGTDPSLDDTLAGLEATLAMPEGAYDGIEIDLLWLGDRCVFAHDAGTPESPGAGLADASRVADLIADSGRAPMLWVELKVGAGTPADRLADCAIDTIARIRPDELVVSSFSPALLAAVEAHPRWRDGELIAELAAADRARLDGFRVTGVSIDPLQIDGPALARYRDLSYDVAVWADAVTPELFAAIERARPRWVSVADVTLVRSWLER